VINALFAFYIRSSVFLDITGVDIFNDNELLKHISRDFHTKRHKPYLEREKCATLEAEMASHEARVERRNKRKNECEHEEESETQTRRKSVEYDADAPKKYDQEFAEFDTNPDSSN
jgi:hypothetical protein